MTRSNMTSGGMWLASCSTSRHGSPLVPVPLHLALTRPGRSALDVVNVVLPLYMLTAALASGAYGSLLGPQGRFERRHRWELDVGERITFPAPVAGSDPVGFPRRASV